MHSQPFYTNIQTVKDSIENCAVIRSVISLAINSLH